MTIKLKIKYLRLLGFLTTIKSSLKNEFIKWKKKQIDLSRDSKLGELYKNIYREKNKILKKNTLLLYNLIYSGFYLEFL